MRSTFTHVCRGRTELDMPVLVAILFTWATFAAAASPGRLAAEGVAELPRIGPARPFELTTQDNQRLSLEDLRGKVVAVSFIYTTCPDVCPLLTYKLVGVQNALGSHFGSNVHFVSITMDPEVDTPEVLASYAEILKCDTSGWSFLTGTVAEVRQAARGYGTVFEKQESGFVDHSLLTSIVDRDGVLRVQYMGHQFDPDEFADDLRNLLNE